MKPPLRFDDRNGLHANGGSSVMEWLKGDGVGIVLVGLVAVGQAVIVGARLKNVLFPPQPTEGPMRLVTHGEFGSNLASIRERHQVLETYVHSAVHDLRNDAQNRALQVHGITTELVTIKHALSEIAADRKADAKLLGRIAAKLEVNDGD